MRQPDGKTGSLLARLYAFGWLPVNPEFNVIDTDYSSYAIVHSCSLWYGFRKEEGARN